WAPTLRRCACHDPSQTPFVPWPLQIPLPLVAPRRPEPLAHEPPDCTVTLTAPLGPTRPWTAAGTSPALLTMPFVIATGYLTLAGQAPPRVSMNTQQSPSKPSSATSAFFIKAGGRSSSLACASGLKILKWCRPAAVQNTTCVSIGGQPGTLQASSDTITVSASLSAKRALVQPRRRTTAAARSGLFVV